MRVLNSLFWWYLGRLACLFIWPKISVCCWRMVRILLDFKNSSAKISICSNCLQSGDLDVYYLKCLKRKNLEFGQNVFSQNFVRTEHLIIMNFCSRKSCLCLSNHPLVTIDRHKRLNVLLFCDLPPLSTPPVGHWCTFVTRE